MEKTMNRKDMFRKTGKFYTVWYYPWVKMISAFFFLFFSLFGF